MCDIISRICSKCYEPAWSFFKAESAYICKFEDNLEELKTAFGDLKAKRDDVLRRVNDEELNGGTRLAVVGRWLSEVETIETDTDQLVADASPLVERLSTQYFCNLQIFSAYSCGKKIPKKLIKVEKLSSKGVFEVVAVAGTATQPVGGTNFDKQTFGLESKLFCTWRLLLEDDVRMLGLYGMGGVGKTTLLTRIKNEFLEATDRFDVVIWVKVSKDVHIGQIQDDIRKRIGLNDENWCKKSQSERASEISRVLQYKKPRFVLLLDDLWEEVSLNEIGIPETYGGGYKIAFTTRFKDVCGTMGANEDVEIECLAEKDAWDLFKIKARCGRLNEEISDIAKKIAANCHGLPLALEVIGKAMSSKKTVAQWSRALSKLESSPSDLIGTEDSLFRVLKLSYDNLEKEDAKSCFLYCALFPKASYIRKDELVEYWIAEGFINEEGGRQRATDRGYDIIDTLVGAGLLLEDEGSEQKAYIMHDIIWEMALWIVSVIKDGEKYVVQAGAGLRKLPEIKNWKPVTKVSLMTNEIESIIDSSRFPNPDRLVTLFLQNNNLVDILGRFFQVLSTLVVLDLSRNIHLTELPEEISMLVALRYLNLSGTMIKDLPSGFGNLSKLIHLDSNSFVLFNWCFLKQKLLLLLLFII